MASDRLEITHPDGSTDEVPLNSASIERERGTIDTARLRTDREAVDGANIALRQKKESVAAVSASGIVYFEGRVDDVTRDGSSGTLEILARSLLAWAADAPRTGGDPPATFEQVDDAVVIDDAVDRVPQLSVANLQTVESGVSFVFTRASPGKMIQTVAQATGGTVRVAPGGGVFYADTFGADRSTTITRDAVAGDATAVESFRVREVGDSEVATHLTMIGAGTDQYQREVTAVPAADGGSYPNKTTYTNPTWSSGDPEIWRDVANKEQTDIATLQTEARTRVEELSTEHIEVETVLTVDDVTLGDTFRVVDAATGIDQRLRVVRYTREITPTGDLYRAVLSSRTGTRTLAADKQALDVSRHNKAYQGDLISVNASGGRRPVDSGANYQLDFKYPANVVYERELELQVTRYPFRSFIAGAGSHSHDVSISTTSANNADFTNTVESASTIASASYSGGTWTDIATISPSSNTSSLTGWLRMVVVDDTNAFDGELRLRNKTDGADYPVSGGVSITVGADQSGAGGSSTSEAQFHATDYSNTTGDTLALQVKPGVDTLLTFSTYFVGAGQHTHSISETQTSTAVAPPAEPGVQDFPGETASNVAAVVNGGSPISLFGGGGTTDTVDLRGLLSAGQFNTIEVTSDTVGHIAASVGGEVYVQNTG
jgi:hypothetical protein